MLVAAEGELRCDLGRRDRGYGTGEQHPGTRSEVLVDEAELRAAECRAADEDEQVYTHDPAADRVGRGRLYGGVRGGQQQQRARADREQEYAVDCLSWCGGREHLDRRQNGGEGDQRAQAGAGPAGADQRADDRSDGNNRAQQPVSAWAGVEDRSGVGRESYGQVRGEHAEDAGQDGRPEYVPMVDGVVQAAAQLAGLSIRRLRGV